ncbi:MAG: hypothetical protein WBC91_23835 [Phototrophicaceae bacterium]
MINLLRAEFLKSRRNLAVSVLSVGVLPVTTIVLLTVFTMLDRFTTLQSPIATINLNEQVILALLFANQIIAQGLYIIFAAVSFGSETTWNTWKNILPRTDRNQIVIAKYIIIIAGIIFSTQMMAIMTVIGSLEYAIFLKLPIETGAWNDFDIPFVQQYLWVSFAIFANFFMASFYASIAAIITRSTSAGIVIGFMMTFADNIAQAALGFISAVFNIGFIADITRILPNYNVQNIMAWVSTGTTLDNWALGLSSMILLVWILSGIIITMTVFLRRDIQ